MLSVVIAIIFITIIGYFVYSDLKQLDGLSTANLKIYLIVFSLIGTFMGCVFPNEMVLFSMAISIFIVGVFSLILGVLLTLWGRISINLFNLLLASYWLGLETSKFNML